MCQYCEKEKAKYYESAYGNLYISTFGNKRTLEIDVDICPKYAECSSKDVRRTIVFPINFCPNCGQQLSDYNPE